MRLASGLVANMSSDQANIEGEFRKERTSEVKEMRQVVRKGPRLGSDT